VPERNRSRRKPAGLFNWLEWLDQEAKTLPRATSWLQPHGPFILARYPNLQPQPTPDNFHSRLFAEWEWRIRENPETAVCLDGLSRELRKQLSALMEDIASAFELRTADKRISTFYKHIIEEASVRERMLNRKLKKVRKAINELKDYAEDSGGDSSNALHRARQVLGTTYRIAADDALRALDARGHNSAKHHIETAKEFWAPEDQEVVYGMIRLYWLFKHGCNNLSGHESEVRVARLRNAFWTEYGVSKVEYRPTYDTVESTGCGAVHLAVIRYKPSKGYKSNENPA